MTLIRSFAKMSPRRSDKFTIARDQSEGVAVRYDKPDAIVIGPFVIDSDFGISHSSLTPGASLVLGVSSLRSSRSIHHLPNLGRRKRAIEQRRFIKHPLQMIATV